MPWVALGPKGEKTAGRLTETACKVEAVRIATGELATSKKKKRRARQLSDDECLRLWPSLERSGWRTEIT